MHGQNHIKYLVGTRFVKKFPTLLTSKVHHLPTLSHFISSSEFLHPFFDNILLFGSEEQGSLLLSLQIPYWCTDFPSAWQLKAAHISACSFTNTEYVAFR